MIAGPMMEKQYSVDFFTHFVSSLQNHCKSFLDFNQLVEVTGYVCVEIDNTKKERYVLSELVQSCGNVVSESYCTKALKVPVLDLPGRKKVMRLRLADTSEETSQTESKLPEEESSDLGLKICSVSSLANTEIGSTCHGLGEDDNIIKTEAESDEALHQGSSYIGALDQRPQQLHESEWEAKDGLVISLSEEEEADGADVTLAESSLMSSQPEPYPLWQRSEDQGNLDLDQILNRGLDGSVQLPQRDEHTAGVNTSKSKQSNLSTQSSNGDDDLTVLNNEYFTAQMLAHSRKALDRKEFPAAGGGSQPSAPRQSSSQSTEQLEPVPSTSQQDPGSSSPMAEAEDDACVLVIDEDSDDVIDVDGEDMDDEDNDMFSESSQDVSEHSSPAISSTAVSRHSSVSEDDKRRKKYKSSLKYQRYAVKLFNNYQKSIGEVVQPIQTMHPEKLDELLANFYKSLRKANGEEFGSVSLRNVQSHLKRHLKDANYPFSLTKDQQFKKSHETLRCKIALARARARSGGAPEKLRPVNEADICLLFESGQLGDGNPDALLNAMWFMNSLYLRIKHNADHYNLRWGDICLARSNSGEEFLTCLVGSSQGRKVHGDQEDPDQCFVRLYKMYRDKRPDNTMALDFPFYLSPHKLCVVDGAWFFPDRASIHRLTGVFKRITTAAGLEGKKLL